MTHPWYPQWYEDEEDLREDDDGADDHAEQLQIFVKLLHRRKMITLRVEASETIGNVTAAVLELEPWARQSPETWMNWPEGSSMVTA